MPGLRQSARPSPPQTAVRKSRSVLRQVGLRVSPFGDLYHFLIARSWPGLFLLMASAYLAVNVVFALLYLAVDGSIAEARPESFWDAFFFSIQTMATIGYGRMYPSGLYADILVSAEAFIGLLGMAMATGILFAKFARPSARVLFSKVAVVAPRDGIKSLMFRMANGRLSQIADASVRAVLVRTERTVEGERVRRVVDLKLVRSSTPVFTFTWTAVHQIKRTSPLYRQDSEALIASDAVIMVTVTGIDETFAQSIHARHIYEAREVLWGFLFVDIMLAAPGGGYVVDYRKFHDVRPASAPEAREGAEAPTK